MQEEMPVDYANDLHSCWECEKWLRLMAYPVKDGWIAATVCGCRDKNGLPRRYSTESETFPTLDAAEVAISRLLHPPKVTAPEITSERNVNWHKASGKWIVQIKRNRRQYTVGYFDVHEDAVKARDDFLTEELEAA